MRHLLLLLTFMFMNSSLTFSQIENLEAKKLGLVSHLTTVKILAEFKMISLAKDSMFKTKTEKAQEFISEYNLLRLSVEIFINQLSSDLYLANKPKYFKKINAFIKGNLSSLPANLSHYEKAIIEIDKNFEVFMINTYSSTLSGPSLGDVTGTIELAHTITSDIRDFKAKKIELITTQLNTLKLDKLIDLIEPKEKSEK
ncbi:MAG: hypothetical protein R2788_25145 [Saprospiraceae bacterium]